MDEKALFLKFWEKEAPATRKVISRIPQDQSDYKPEPKSRTAREIAWLIVMEEKVLVEGLEKGTVEWQDFPAPATVEEILTAYDRNHEDFAKRLHELDAGVWEKEFRFVYGEYEISRGTGYHFGWEFLFDAVHHRGQLSTYLRPMGSTVPSIYGPSADEPF
ncbi:MAG: DinB family protein [Acidobacteriota bacterium]